MSAAQVLRYLYALDTSSPDFMRYLYCLIQCDDKEQYLSGLQGPDLVQLVDFLDGVLGVTPVNDEISRRCLHKLQAICSQSMILPSSYSISGKLAGLGADPVTSGGFSDVWEGEHDGTKVCIKRPRITMQSREVVEKAFYKEAIMWKRLRHPNVVPFIGITRNPLQFVSEWMPNGTLTEYVNKYPSANRIGLLLDVAEGLAYLHAKHATHGDLKGPNILIDHGGHARLTDFGFASVVRGLHSVHLTPVQGFTPRWAAPEVIETGDKNTREADVFSFAMVVIEVFTGRHPFSEFTSAVTISKIMGGERPGRPQHPDLTDSVWDMTHRCWQQNPVDRFSMTSVVGTLRQCYWLCFANLDLSVLAPQLVESVPSPIPQIFTDVYPASSTDDDENISPMTPSASDEDPTLTRSPRTSHHSGLLHPLSHGASANLNPMFSTSSPSVFRSSPRSSCGSLLGDSGAYSDPGHSYGDHPHSSVRTTRKEIEPPRFGEAHKRIDQIAEDLAYIREESKWESINKLRKLCGRFRTIPTSYKLRGVKKQGGYPERISRVTEIWKGVYRDEVVVLKVLMVPKDDPDMQETESSFCKEVALMKNIFHENVLPFYGISTSVSKFCLVFPWYENGTVMNYLEENPDADRYNLLSGAVSGLRFLHDHRIVHGDLRPDHILIDDDGKARLATAGRSSIVTGLDPGSNLQGHSTFEVDVPGCRYSAPEIQRAERSGVQEIPITRASDVYGMSMVIYEVLTGKKPYYDYNDNDVLSVVRAGEVPVRLSGRIDDLAWGLLEKCWSRVPGERPTAAEVSTTFSNLSSRPRVNHAPRGQIAMGGALERNPSLTPSSSSNVTPISPERKLIKKTPSKLELQLRGIRFSQDQPKGRRFYVKLKYGNQSHTTSPTDHIGHLDGHTWILRESWVVRQADVLRRRGQVAFEVFIQAGALKRDKVCAKGSFLLFDNVHKQIDVDLKEVEGGGSGTLKVSIVG